MLNNIRLLLLLIVSIPSSLLAQHVPQQDLNWSWRTLTASDYEIKAYLPSGCQLTKGRAFLPMIHHVVPVSGYGSVSANLTQEVWTPFEGNAESLPYFNEAKKVSSNIDASVALDRGQPKAMISVYPVRFKNGAFEVLTSYSIRYSIRPKAQSLVKRRRRSGGNSKLSTGDWYKMGVTKSGVYRLSYSYLKAAGIDVDNISSNDVKVFGYGGRMLPMSNAEARPEDMAELPTVLVDGGDGRLNDGDYMLFYGEGPVSWDLTGVGTHIRHRSHVYSDTIYYFISASSASSRRVTTASSISEPASLTLSWYDRVVLHATEELTDVTEYVKTGQDWFGEEFNFTPSMRIDLGNVPNAVIGEDFRIRASAVARSPRPSDFFFNYGNTVAVQLELDQTETTDYLDFARKSSKLDTATVTGENFSFTVRYDKPTSSSIGWLNFIELNVPASLQFGSSQLEFRSVQAANHGGVVQYNIQNARQGMRVWEVSDLAATRQLPLSTNGTVASFKTNGDRLRTFVAFTDNQAMTPAQAAKVRNQNLHSLGSADMVIVTHDKFRRQAEELAELHRKEDGLSVIVASTREIYNEFSSGTQDIAAIRDFVRYIYLQGESDENRLKHLLLYGDASYDFKNRIRDNTNYVPSYQSLESISPIGAYVSDDFFGLLDEEEGDWERSSGLLDLSIGRLPVRTTAEASDMIKKIRHYYSEESLGAWRNNLCFVADDEDGGLHLEQAEWYVDLNSNLKNISIETNYPVFNISKIYYDAFPQQTTSAGQRYPDVNKQINRAVENGVLLINYTGHGGEVGWAHERVLGIPDIRSWKNLDRLAVFVTATCEFSRYDDPTRTSAGELVLLNPEGGAIAMLTTTRVVTAQSNDRLLRVLYNKENIFKAENGQYKTLGEVVRFTKNGVGLSNNTRKFSLLGDPAIRIAFPQHKVVTNEINNTAVSDALQDTISALSKVSVSGSVTDVNDLPLDDYNGILFVTVYDKADTVSTLQNDGSSPKWDFGVQNSIIYKGKASVTNGKFSFEFVVPKDISYRVGAGKISYYTHDNSIDGNGYFNEFLVGGTSANPIEDNQKPDVSLFMNDLKFTFGGLTNETPLLIAQIKDDFGVNTLGNGFGHDLTAIIDGGDPIIMNDYYEAELDNYRSGEIRYPMDKVSEGRHSVLVRAWDVANNPGEGYTEFVVASSAKMALDHVFNYPNPFTTNTEFRFDHNKPGEPMDIIIQIFSITGRLVKTIQTSVISEGNVVSGINWDGRDDYGNNIGKGVYVYQLKVRTASGKHADHMEKLVILR